MLSVSGLWAPALWDMDMSIYKSINNFQYKHDQTGTGLVLPHENKTSLIAIIIKASNA